MAITADEIQKIILDKHKKITGLPMPEAFVWWHQLVRAIAEAMEEVNAPRTKKLDRKNELSAELQEEVSWRISETWEAHMKQRRGFWREAVGKTPPEPHLTNQIKKHIREAILEFDRDWLAPDKREQWAQDSWVRAAGIGLFLDKWCTGQDPENNVDLGGKRYLEPWRAWMPQRGKGHPVPRFADLYFARRDGIG